MLLPGVGLLIGLFLVTAALGGALLRLTLHQHHAEDRIRRDVQRVILTLAAETVRSSERSESPTQA
jgi:hypothetical protein